jgi:hypothetical protein
MQLQVESWRQTQIADAQAKAKLIFYSAFIDSKLDAPKSLLSEVHRFYFEPEYPEFSARTMWRLSNSSRVFSRVSNCGTDGETAIALFCRAHPFVKDPTQILLQIKSEKARIGRESMPLLRMRAPKSRNRSGGSNVFRIRRVPLPWTESILRQLG